MIISCLFFFFSLQIQNAVALNKMTTSPLNTYAYETYFAALVGVSVFSCVTGLENKSHNGSISCVSCYDDS